MILWTEANLIREARNCHPNFPNGSPGKTMSAKDKKKEEKKREEMNIPEFVIFDYVS